MRMIYFSIFICTVCTKNRNADDKSLSAVDIAGRRVFSSGRLRVVDDGDDDDIAATSARFKLKTYRPIWEDLDLRPLPKWYDVAKIGIFVHWGVYSVPGFKSEWFWYYWKTNDEEVLKFMESYPSNFTYQEFAPMFTADFFDPSAWAALFARSGAKYVVLTAKHHDGYSLFPSKYSFSWNSVDVGPKADLVKLLSKAIRKHNIKFGLYYSLMEWFNPLYLEDKKADYFTTVFTDNKVLPELKQLVNDYKPSVLWSDGDWEAQDTYWKSQDFLAWLYNESPVKDEVVVNDRWGCETAGHHGDFFNFQDKYDPGYLINHKWESAFSIDTKSWGYRRNINIHDILTIEDLLKQIVRTVSCGGNVLINVGPTKEGTIAPIFQERLLQLGAWLEINGKAIYGTSPWFYQNDELNTDVWYTCTKVDYNDLNPTFPPNKADVIEAVYIIYLKWPINNILKLSCIAVYLDKGKQQLDLLGNNNNCKNLHWQLVNGSVEISLPVKSAVVTSKYAWVLRMSQVKS